MEESSSNSRVVDFPRGAHLTVGELIDGYAVAYTGHDRWRISSLSYWKDRLGHLPLSSVTSELVQDALDDYARQPRRRYVGRDANGQPVYRELDRPRAAGTINAMRATLSAVIQWAKRRRIAPKGYVNPVRDVPAERLNNARTRFLDANERERLFKAAKCSKWGRMYLLVLMAVTTGARRGELMGLHWQDVDLDAGTAHLSRTKNGSQRVLVLLPHVVAELKRHVRGTKPEHLIFHGRSSHTKAMALNKAWARVVTDAKLKDFRFHDLRHTCASYLAQQGSSTVQIAEVLGHKTLDMARRYSHLNVDHKRDLMMRVMGNIK